MSDKYEAKHVG